jgi:hypothetical protein
MMDRGVPTEELLTEMRSSDPPIYFLVGTPKGRLSNWKPIYWNGPGKACVPG